MMQWEPSQAEFTIRLMGRIAAKFPGLRTRQPRFGMCQLPSFIPELELRYVPINQTEATSVLYWIQSWIVYFLNVLHLVIEIFSLAVTERPTRHHVNMLPSFFATGQ